MVRRKLAAAILITILCLPGLARADRKLTNFRYWTAPDHTRIVIDVSAPPTYAHRVLGNPDRIAIDVHDASFQGGTRKIAVNDGLIRSIRMNQLRSGKAQVVLDLEARARYRIFLLDPVADKPDRIVIDVYRSKVSGTTRPPRDDSLRLVIIDAGHGGDDPGATGLYGIREKNLTLDIAKRLARKIDSMPGLKAVSTRKGDYFMPLRSRSDFARESGGDVFISIHANSARSSSARGFEIFFLSLRGATDKMASELAHKENAADLIGGTGPATEDEVLSILFDYLSDEGMVRSQALAETIYKRFQRSSEVKTRNVKQAGFAVLKSIEIPAVLVEVGFLTNKGDASRLREEGYREKLAGYLAEGIEEYFERAGSNGVKYHVVQKGETAWSIASRYDLTVNDLMKTNNLGGDAALQVGQKIRVR